MKILGINKKLIDLEIVIQMTTLYGNTFIGETFEISEYQKYISSINNWLSLSDEDCIKWLTEKVKEFTVEDYEPYGLDPSGLYIDLPDEFYEDLYDHWKEYIRHNYF